MLEELKKLTLEKKYTKIKNILEKAPVTEKGQLFEQYLAFLYEGQGLNVVISGKTADAGADLLLIDRKNSEKNTHVVQAKNHNKPLTWDGTSSALNKFEKKGKSKYKCDDFILISLNGFVKEAKKLDKYMSLLDWDDIKEFIDTYDENVTERKLGLKAHNRKAVQSINKLFKKYQRVSVIQATGTGKSYIIGHFLIKYSPQPCIVLTPSDYIQKQQKKLVRELKNVTYMNYQVINKKTTEEWKKQDYKFIVLDEFHRVGAPTWGNGVNRLLEALPKAKVLGTTATHIRHLDKERNMAEETFNGVIAQELPIEAAIARGILPSPHYVCALYSFDETFNKYDKSIKNNGTKEEQKTNLDDLKKAKLDWEKSSGVPEVLDKYLPELSGKYLIFCESVAHIYEMQDQISIWFRKAAKLKKTMQGRETIDRKTYVVHSGTKSYPKTKAQNKNALEGFTKADASKEMHAILTVDMLNEGLHVDGIKGVILLRKTKSPTIYLQQIGRCLQVKGKTPYIFDFVNNMDKVDTDMFTKKLPEALKKENELRKEYGLNQHKIRIHLHDESKNIKTVLDSIKSRLEKNKPSFETSYQRLVEFKKQFNHCRVTDSYDPILATWLQKQRSLNRRGEILPERFNKLDSLGVNWEPDEEIWNTMFAKLIAFHKKYNTFSIPKGYEDEELFLWVQRQRANQKAGRLSASREKSLSDRGFHFDDLEHKWDIQYQKLLKFTKQHGHSNIPRSYQDSSLANWILIQRQKMLKGIMEEQYPHRYKKLKALGFSPEPYEQQWNEMFNRLKQFKKDHGSFDVPSNYSDKKLLNWISKQRTMYEKGDLDPDKEKKLRDAGFSLSPYEDAWNAMYQELVKFYNKHKNLDVPYSDEKYTKLSRWVTRQRTDFKSGKMMNNNPERKEKLDAINFDYKVKKNKK